MAVARPIRVLALATGSMLIFIVYLLQRSSIEIQVGRLSNAVSGPAYYRTDKNFRDPNLDPSLEPAEPLRRVQGKNYAPDNPQSDRINATLLALVRNSELDGMISSMRDLERTFNRKFNYPWLFLNDEPFTDEFKRRISAETRAKVTFDIVPKAHWDQPEWINQDLYDESVQVMKKKGVRYVDKKSYHQMCRWNSGMFYHHPQLLTTRWYWRVEPNVHFFCDIDYDVFGWMHDHNKTYGFTINLFDNPESVQTLWPETLNFLANNPGLTHDNNAIDWLKDAEHRPGHNRRAHGYSTCHFWSNFEIADMEFYRSPAYTAYFNHLDKSGGFFYERWGDAPVHSIALGLFEDKSKIHWFQDIGYQHIPFFNCPNSPKCRGCIPGKFTDGEAWLHQEDCRPIWFKVAGKESGGRKV